MDLLPQPYLRRISSRPFLWWPGSRGSGPRKRQVAWCWLDICFPLVRREFGILFFEGFFIHVSTFESLKPCIWFTSTSFGVSLFVPLQIAGALEVNDLWGDRAQKGCNCTICWGRQELGFRGSGSKPLGPVGGAWLVLWEVCLSIGSVYKASSRCGFP